MNHNKDETNIHKWFADIACLAGASGCVSNLGALDSDFADIGVVCIRVAERSDGEVIWI